jgi:hypothetical protein
VLCAVRDRVDHGACRRPAVGSTSSDIERRAAIDSDIGSSA